MKKPLQIVVLLVLSFLFTQAVGQNPNTFTSCFKSNMHCAACENTIFELLRFEKGVKDLKVDHVSNTIKVDFDKRKNSEESLAKVIEAKGYKAEKITPEEYANLNDAKKRETNGNQEQKP